MLVNKGLKEIYENITVNSY